MSKEQERNYEPRPGNWVSIPPHFKPKIIPWQKNKICGGSMGWVLPQGGVAACEVCHTQFPASSADDSSFHKVSR